MFALQGYYDGNVVQTLGNVNAKKNQKLIITVLDEFMDEEVENIVKKSARGALSAYANAELQREEKTAWGKATVEKYGNA